MWTIQRVGPTLEIRDHEAISAPLMRTLQAAVDIRAGFSITQKCMGYCGYDAILVEHPYGGGDTSYRTDGHHVVAVLRWSWGREKTVRYSLYVAARNA